MTSLFELSSTRKSSFRSAISQLTNFSDLFITILSKRRAGQWTGLFLSLALTIVPVQSYSAEAGFLELGAKNVVAAPRGEELLMLLDLQAYREKLRALKDDEIKTLLIETARHYLSETFKSKRFRADLSKSEVIFAFVQNMDEYNRPNSSGMVRIGTARFEREGDEQKNISAEINLNLVKQ